MRTCVDCSAPVWGTAKRVRCVPCLQDWKRALVNTWCRGRTARRQKARQRHEAALTVEVEARYRAALAEIKARRRNAA